MRISPITWAVQVFHFFALGKVQKYGRTFSNLTRKVFKYFPLLRARKKAAEAAHFSTRGGGEIRTHGALRHTAFQVRHIRPLWHPSLSLNNDPHNDSLDKLTPNYQDYYFYVSYLYDEPVISLISYNHIAHIFHLWLKLIQSLLDEKFQPYL